MAPKKAEDSKFTPLGKLSANLSIGIVGLPNVGKSTFFNALTNSSIPAENFPFCTVDPNESRVAVPDERFDWLVKHWDPVSVVPAYLKVWDIAGLVKGAHKGDGLGNAFLANIKTCDAIFHMVRVFENDEITHTEGGVDPIRDIDIINKELLLKDEHFLQNRHDSLYKAAISGDKQKKKELDIIVKALDAVKNDIPVRFLSWKGTEVPYLNTYDLLSAKPVIYLVNMSPKDYKDKTNPLYKQIKEHIEKIGQGIDRLVPFSAEMESKFAKLKKKKNGDELIANLCKSHGVKSALPEIIRIGYDALNLGYFFTAGKKEVRAWTIRAGMTAPQAAGRIHTDFQDLFIKAEIMRFEDYKKYGSEAEVKKNGQLLMKGKDYVIDHQAGEIIHFKFGERGGGAKKK